MFEEELTNGEDYAKMTSYGSSFLTDRFNKK
jgi:hypothetical protein